ncbi:DUF2141 domain-containing protein [Bacteroidota bacterium]
MKYILALTLTFCLHLYNHSYCQEKTDNKSIILEITNLRSETGQIGLSIYNSKEGFPKEESRIYRKVIIYEWEGGTARTIIEDLPYGEYAICLWHDENRDNDMNYSFFGIPKEGYCFSNNVKPTLRAPKWEEAKFTFSRETVIQEIEMKYW